MAQNSTLRPEAPPFTASDSQPGFLSSAAVSAAAAATQQSQVTGSDFEPCVGDTAASKIKVHFSENPGLLKFSNCKPVVIRIQLYMLHLPPGSAFLIIPFRGEQTLWVVSL